MHVSPVLAGLRRVPAPQLSAQAALEKARDAWRALPQVVAVLRDLEAYGSGASARHCPGLLSLVEDFDAGRSFVDAFVARQVATLRDHPLGHVAFRYQQRAGLSILELARAGRASLSLLCYSAAANPPLATVCFAGGESRELALAGSGDVQLFELHQLSVGGASITGEERRIEAGDCLTIAGNNQAKFVARARGRLTVLRLARIDGEPLPTREYRLADGALVHTASGCRRESREEMAAAVLGAMDRADAVPVLAALVGSGSDHLRWQALRQVLALDSLEGFSCLTRIAGDALDPLAAPAGALRASLAETYPQLLEMTSPCR